MVQKNNKLDESDNGSSDQSDQPLGKKQDIDINALEIDMEHHIFVGGITQSGKSFFIKHLFDAIKKDSRRCIFFDYKNDPAHVDWIRKKHYPIFNSINTLKRYWTPLGRFSLNVLLGKTKPKQKKVIFRPPRPKGFGGAFKLLDDLADFVFREGNMILFVDEIAPLMSGNKIPPALYDCLIMGASRGVTVIAVSQRPKDIHNIVLSEAYTKILFRLNLEDDRKKIKGIAGQEVADKLYNLPNTHFVYVRADGYHQTCRLSDKNEKKGKNGSTTTNKKIRKSEL